MGTQAGGGGISEADRLSMLKPVGSEGNDIKPPVLSKFLPPSQGVDYYNTQGFLAGMVMRYSQPRSWLEGILKYITRDATGVHANESGPSIAAASSGEGSYGDSGGGGGGGSYGDSGGSYGAGAPIEAATSNFSFSDFASQGGAYASSMVSRIIPRRRRI
jgi:hypothetical protein